MEYRDTRYITLIWHKNSVLFLRAIHQNAYLDAKHNIIALHTNQLYIKKKLYSSSWLVGIKHGILANTF